MFRRKLLIIALAIGTVGGYAAGFRSMRHCRYQRHGGLDCQSAYTEGFAAGARACAEAAREK